MHLYILYIGATWIVEYVCLSLIQTNIIIHGPLNHIQIQQMTNDKFSDRYLSILEI
jgi:hypothetical protein